MHNKCKTVQGFSTSIESLYTDMVIQESKNKRQILQWISKLKLVESCSIYFVVANKVVARSSVSSSLWVA